MKSFILVIITMYLSFTVFSQKNMNIISHVSGSYSIAGDNSKIIVNNNKTVNNSAPSKYTKIFINEFSKLTKNDSTIFTLLDQILEQVTSIPKAFDEAIAKLKAQSIEIDTIKSKQLKHEIDILDKDGDFTKVGDEFIFNPHNTLIKKNVVFKSDFKFKKLQPFKVDNHFGYIDSSGNEVIKPMYDEAYEFNEGYAIVKKGSSWRLIDESNSLKYFFENTVMVFPVYKGKVAYVTENNNLGIYKFDPVIYKDSTLSRKNPLKATIENTRSNYSFLFFKREYATKYCINFISGANGNILIQTKNIISSVFKFKNNSVLHGNMYSIINYEGDILERLNYHYISPNNFNGVTAIKYNNLWGIYDVSQSTEVIKPQYKKIEEIIFEYTIVENTKNEFSIIDMENNRFLPFGDWKIERLKNNLVKFTSTKIKENKKPIFFITDVGLNCIQGDCGYLNK